ncbi:unnamed protein product, partial [Prorocentrum cordatum]
MFDHKRDQRDALHGYRGQRVGEASHPGPPHNDAAPATPPRGRSQADLPEPAGEVSGESAPRPAEAETPPRELFGSPGRSLSPLPAGQSHFSAVFGQAPAAEWDFSGLFAPPRETAERAAAEEQQQPQQPQQGPDPQEPEQPEASEVCYMCQEPLDDSRVQWPDCGHVPHCFHATCLARFRPLRRGLAHLRNSGGDSSRVEDAACPLCNHRWGDGPNSAARLAELAGHLGRGGGLPFRGCRCLPCRGVAGDPSSDEERANRYRGGPLVLPEGPAPHAITMCPRHPERPMRWRHSRGPDGLTGSWECAACDVAPLGSEVPPPLGERPPQCPCGQPGQVEWVARASGDAGGPWRWQGNWLCESCAATALPEPEAAQPERPPETGAGGGSPDPPAADGPRTQFSGWSPPRHAAETSRYLNSWMYVPLLLDAAGQLDAQEAAAWRQHPAAAHWWENAAAFLRERPRADAPAFRAAGPLLPQALGDGLHGDQLGLPAVVGLLADDRGYVQPIAQDIVMQIFGGVDFIRAVEVQADAYRAEDEEALEEAEGAEAPEEAEGEQAAEETCGRRNRRPAQSAFPDAAWALLDAVDLEAELRRRVPCIRAPPAFLRGRLRQLYHTVLEEVLRADALPGDADGLQKVRAWKLLVLIWRMLLRRTASTGAPGRRELEARLEQFEDGPWEALLAPSLQGQRPPGGARGAGDAEARRQRALEDAVALVRAGGLSKARQLLASRGLAPGTAETLAELRDPARRPPRPAADLPPAARAFQPTRPVELDRRIWTDCVRSAPKGSSSSLSGASFELLKLALDEDETLELQAAVAERYARAEIPASVARALGTGRMTALLKAHDRGLQEALHDLLDLDPAPAEAERLSRVSSLPLGLGGLGLRSAARTAECAYWASWADALPMLRQRNPTAATELTATLLAGTGAAASCLQEAERARAAAARDGFATCPTWQEVWDGARPEQTEPEPGEWKHGWQYHASAARERRYREEVVLPSLTDDQQWMLDSQGGRCGGRHLALIPSTPESTFTPERFRALLQRRLRLPLDATASRCNGRSCQAHLDERGDHRAACPRSGRLLKRGAPIERMWARVCREAGGRVRTDVFLRDMNLPGIAANDGRRIEVVANGLPAYHGRQLAIDACIVSPLRATGRPIARRLRPGLALKRARRRKQTTYPELVGSRRGYLLVAGAETGGRRDEEAYKLLVTLARARARSAPAALRGSLATALLHRWSGMLAYAIHDALAASLLEDVPSETLATDGENPWRGDVLS